MQPAAIKNSVTTEDLTRLDIQIGTIDEVTDSEEPAKLVAHFVDVGDRRRMIVAGVKGERDDPTEITGERSERKS